MFQKFFLKLIILLSLFITNNSYSHQAQGVDRKKLSEQVAALVEKLSAGQQKEALDRFDSKLRSKWHYIPTSRRGLSLKSLNKTQKKYVMSTLRSFLSQQGFQAATTIMELEKILDKEESFSFINRDPEAYYLEIFGNPNPKSTWGLSFEGHHLSLNYVIQRNRIKSFSPMFFGANPAHVKKNYGTGPKKNTRPLAELENIAFELINSLEIKARTQAVISSEAIDDVRNGGSISPPLYEKTGVVVDKFSDSQFNTFKRLLIAYLNLMPNDLSVNIRTMEDNQLRKETYFSWYGSLKPNVGHYYRIDHPKFVIELANTQSDVSGNPANHVHALLRQRDL